jgi:hypothetical protein
VKRQITKKLAIFGVAIFAMSCGGPDNEALRLGEKYFNERLLKCGDSWFGRHSRGFVQMKDVKLQVIKSFLSEADKANGWEWKGHVGLNVRIFRSYSHGPGWSEWALGPEARTAWYPSFEHLVNLTRRNGRWQVEPRAADFGGVLGGDAVRNLMRQFKEQLVTDNFEKVDFTCASVPQ